MKVFERQSSTPNIPMHAYLHEAPSLLPFTVLSYVLNVQQ